MQSLCIRDNAFKFFAIGKVFEDRGFQEFYINLKKQWQEESLVRKSCSK